MGWGIAGMIAYQWYSDQKNRKLAAKLSTPVPVTLKYGWNPAQKQMYNWMSPYMAGMFGQPGKATPAATLAAQPGTKPLWESKQYGGPVEGQAPYLVGEASPGQTRPEMFVPNQPGQNPYLVGEGGPQTFNPEQSGEIVPSTSPTVLSLIPRQTGGSVDPILGTMPTPTPITMGPAPAPTGDWYSSLDPSVREGIEQPYMRGMEMLESRLQGRGALGAQRAGISGAGADVLAQYIQQAAPSMAQTGWGMMTPGLQQRQAGQIQADITTQGQEWEGKLLPYKMLPSLLPYMMPTAYTSAAPAKTPTAAPAYRAPTPTGKNIPLGRGQLPPSMMP